ncbi:MAG: tetratricopeptide repeat protein, partial [Pseudomonadota bacterium]
MRPLALLALLVVAACDTPEERAAEHYERATAFLEAGDDDKAIVEFRNVLQVEETNVDARFQLAKLLKEKGRGRAATRNFLRLIELSPEHLEGRIELASLLLDNRQIDAALKHSEAAYKLAPDDVRVLAQRATVALFLGNYELAEKLALRALEIDPFSPTAGLVLTAHKMRTEDREGALEVVDRFLGYDPSIIDLHLAKLQILQQMGDMGPIGEQLILMVEKFPDVAGFR